MSQMIDFEDIRSFNDNEYKEKAASLLNEPQFRGVISAVMPEVDYEQFSQMMMSLNSIKEFQHKIIASFVNKIIKTTTTGLTYDGAEHLDPEQQYLFMSNHRDIVLDASFLCMALIANQRETCEIAIGNNLLVYEWISNLVRLNKSFIVKRGVGIKQALEAAKQLSAYIHYAINEKGESVWIAQREGRSKDSNDRTQDALIKMLSLGNNGSLIDNIRQLNIMPISISYEYDPCDSLKAYELLQKSKDPNFKKSQRDDLISMQTGIMGYKGTVNYHFTGCINDELKALEGIEDKAIVIQSISQIIDRHIHLNYKIYPGNYIAYDMLYNSNQYTQQYTEQQKTAFEEYLHSQIAKLGPFAQEDYDTMKNTMLKMYSNPLKNKVEALSNKQ